MTEYKANEGEREKHNILMSLYEKSDPTVSQKTPSYHSSGVSKWRNTFKRNTNK